jgi:predicted RNA binding protein YcfA (HicA-like mRNA interferase family)
MPKIGTIHWKEFEKFLLSQGCEFKREKGDHRIYWKAGMNRPIVVPRDTQLPQMIILNNLRTLGIERDEYLSFLKRLKK